MKAAGKVKAAETAACRRGTAGRRSETAGHRLRRRAAARKAAWHRFQGTLAAVVACAALVAQAQDEGVIVTDDGSPVAVGDSIGAQMGSAIESFMPQMPTAWPTSAPLTNHASAVWTAQVDALWLWRGNVPSVPLFTDLEGAVVLDSNDVNPTAATGPRVGIIRRFGDCHAIEGNWLNVGTFEGTRQLPPDGDYVSESLGGLPPFENIATATVSTWSLFRSAELNGRTWGGGSITWLAGFRWVEWDDRMNVTATDFDEFSGQVDAATGNNLYGGQIGADMRLWNTEGLVRVDGIAKAGVFYNHAAYQRTDANLIDPDGFVEPVGSVSATDDTVSFMGEVGVNASVSITRWLAWRAGYSVFWLSGVATAPQQFAATDLVESTGSVNTNGSVLLHGVTTGLEARW